jgi:predicted enzyme related to lactoylglutathione lyase
MEERRLAGKSSTANSGNWIAHCLDPQGAIFAMA